MGSSFKCATRERERDVALGMEGRHENHHGHDPDEEHEEGVPAGHVRNDSAAVCLYFPCKQVLLPRASTCTYSQSAVTELPN